MTYALVFAACVLQVGFLLIGAFVGSILDDEDGASAVLIIAIFVGIAALTVAYMAGAQP